MDLDDDVFFHSATELAGLIRGRVLSPVELMDGLLARIEQVDPPINAYCTVAADEARAAARASEQRVAKGLDLGPLEGVPVSIKDNIETAGIRTTYGSRKFEDFVPTDDAVCVSRLEAAGAVIVGKTSLPEFAAKGVVDPPLFGHTRNPWDLDRTCGGSSGGAASAVAAGLGPLAIGNDQAGSVRMPASFCGVAALKATGGRIPCYPASDVWDFLLQVGPITRTVDDLDLALRVLEGPHPRDPLSFHKIPEEWDRSLEELARPWRVAWSADVGFADLDPEVRAASTEACEALSPIATIETPPLDLLPARDAYQLLVPLRRAAALAEVIDEWEPLMDPFVVEYTRKGFDLGAADVGRAIAARSTLLERVEDVLADHDLIVTPTLAVTAFEIGRVAPESIDGHPVAWWGAWYPYTYPFNLTGHPAASIPAGWSQDGLPIGLQVVGRRGADRDVLAACRYIERVRPWAERRPATARAR